jgi:hypothetical protein
MNWAITLRRSAVFLFFPGKARQSIYQLKHVSLISILILALLFGAVPVHASSGLSGKLLQQSTGTIVIVKDTVPDSSRDFSFQLRAGQQFIFGTILDDDPSSNNFPNQFSRDVESGTYTVEEFPGTVWAPTAITCDDTDSQGNIATRTATVVVAAGETVTCTFRNELPPGTQPGTIVVIKDTVPNDPQDFTLRLFQHESFILDDDDTSATPNTFSMTVEAGTHLVEEDNPGPDWELTAITCDDAQTTTDPLIRRATIQLQGGETVTCTFMNERVQTGTIVMRKDAVPDDPQDFTFQISGPNGAGGGQLVDDDPVSTNLPNEFRIRLKTGAYTLAENAVSGWTLAGISCDDPGSTPNVQNRSASVDLDADETITCTFTNTKDGVGTTPLNVTIEQATGQADPTSDNPINFSVVFSEPVTGFIGSDVNLSASTAPGTLTAVVTGGPTAYNVAVSGMTGNGTVVASLPANVATAAAGSGNNPSTSTDNTVTFTGTQVTGTIVIVKDAQPDDPQDFNFIPDSGLGSFLLDDDGDPTLSNTKTLSSVAPGTYSVVEDFGFFSGWELTGLTCSDPDNQSSGSTSTGTATIDLDANETVTCTFTNTKQAQQVPDLTISKSHTGSFNQGQTGARYTITVSNVGTGPTSGVVSVVDNLPAGLTSTGLSGSGWSCDLGTLTCTRSDSLTAGNSYPDITLTVNIAGNAPSSVSNTATVSGGGEQNSANNTAGDPTTINPALAAPSCNGQAATIYVNAQGRIVGGTDNGKVYKGKLNGTGGADVIVGANRSDEIDAKGGNDIVCGGNGNDEIEGGSGHDQLFGESGKDELEGEDGNDTLTGGSQADKFKGGPGTDTATDYNRKEGDSKSSVENT